MLGLEEDIRISNVVRSRAVCDCSNYSVGAVLKCKNGIRYSGCNIENDGIQSICAERVAFSSAIADGEKEFERIVIIGGRRGTNNLEKTLPCGYCRQFISQFVEDDFKIYTVYGDKIEEYTINELFPEQFHLKK